MVNKSNLLESVVVSFDDIETPNLQELSITTNPQLLQLLELSAEQLTAFLEEEILDNPFIELDYATAKKTATVNADENGLEVPQTLATFLFEQIMMYRHTEIRDAMVHLVDYLDDRGYIPYTYYELSAKMDFSPIVVLDALTLFKQLEPLGVGAYDLRECLMLQTEQDSHALNVAYYLLEECFEELSNQQYDIIVSKTELSMEEILACVAYYQTLRAVPATLFDRPTATSMVPDITVRADNGKLNVHYNRQYYPRIVFNQHYYEEMKATNDSEVLAFIAPHEDEYRRLAHNLRLREYLILKVAQAVVATQKSYFVHECDDKAPLLIKDIAKLTNISEPIINLIATNKSLEFEKRALPLTDFITVATHQGTTATGIRQAIQEIMLQAGTSVSDAAIVEQLATQNIVISKRMVNDYRQRIQY